MQAGRFFFTLVAVLCLMVLPIDAGGADKTDKLIELLINKGIINSEEAKELQEELEEEGKPQTPGGPPTRADTEEPKEEPKHVDWTEKVEVGYDKGAYIKTRDDRYALKLGVRLQPWFLYQDSEGGDDSTTFRLRRARFVASGNAFYPWLTYFTQITLENVRTEDGASLRDGYITASYLDWLTFEVGQFKVPYNREFITSGFSLQLIERSIANDLFFLGRDIGLQVSGQQIGGVLEYRLGVFNGSGANQSNVDDQYMWAGRLAWTPFGPYPYSQAALDNPNSPHLTLGVGGAYLPKLKPGERKKLAGPLGNTDIVSVESDVQQLVGDLALKYKGFSLEAGYLFRNIDPRESTPYGDQDADGYYVQAGYFIIPQHLELAARYSFAEPDNPQKVDNNKREQTTFGLSYYFFGHRLKTQFNYSLLSFETETGDQDDHVFQASMAVQF